MDNTVEFESILLSLAMNLSAVCGVCYHFLHLRATSFRLWKFLQHIRYSFLFINLHIEINGILDLQLLTLQFPGHFLFREHILLCIQKFFILKVQICFTLLFLKRHWHICIIMQNKDLFIFLRFV